jgi:hypothetical protein
VKRVHDWTLLQKSGPSLAEREQTKRRGLAPVRLQNGFTRLISLAPRGDERVVPFSALGIRDV